MLNIELLIPSSYQPRKIFQEESLNELSKSIKEYGILNPILVRKKEKNYEIIAGERRFRAAKIAGLKEVPVIIKDIAEDKISEIALIENLQRENISPIEEAKSYEKILKNADIDEQKLSQMVGKSPSFITNKLKLLALPSNIKEALLKRQISERHARSLLLINDEIKQKELLNRIINEKLTVKELENIINEKEITETEITTAINDIMKKLSQNENKKEEKESDNMNSGNFFPNYNNNLMSNANASLNSMNMQTMNNSTILDGSIPNPSQEINNNMSNQTVSPLETTEINRNVGTPNEEPQIAPVMDMNYSVPTGNASFFNNSQEFINNNSLNSINNPLPPVTPIFSNQQSEINNNQANINTNSMSINDYITPQPQSATQNYSENFGMIDPPIFNNQDNLNYQPVNNNESAIGASSNYEVPTETLNSTIPRLESNKLTMLEEFLRNNDISYKKYNNETNNCLIIEINK